MTRRFVVSKKLNSCHWELTHGCNLRCVHCMVEAGSTLEDELSTEEALNLADELIGEGCKTVGLTGGEPLLREDWPQIAKRLIDGGVDVVIASNGWLIGDEIISSMVDIGVKGVSISIDGTREVHDSIRQSLSLNPDSRYDRAIRAIELLVSSPLKVAVQTQIHKQDIDRLGELHNTLADLKINLWQLQLAIPRGRLMEFENEYMIDSSQIDGLTDQVVSFIEEDRIFVSVGDNIGYLDRKEPRIRRTLKKTAGFWSGCSAGLNVVAIRPNGDVKGCTALPDSFSVGNVRERSFFKIWNDDQCSACNTEFDVLFLEGECARCSFSKLCKAGCTAMAFCVTGTIYNNPYCVRHERLKNGEAL